MSTVSIGDAAQQFISLRNGNRIKSDLSQLAESLSTGKVTDIAKTLNGETTRFSGLRYSLAQLDSYQLANQETGQYLAAIQTVLGRVDAERSSTAERLLLVNDSSTIAQINETAISSRGSFEIIVRTLNTQIADRSLLSGAASDRAPLAAADSMLADLQVAIAGATDAPSIMVAIETWFADPSGGFATSGYLGDTGAFVEKRVSDTKTLEMTARVDDPAIVDVLKGTAIAALADLLPGLDSQTKSELLQISGQQLFAASSEFVAVQASVGRNEAELARTQSENSSSQTALGIIQNELVSADPFETATALQAVQLQLETHFAVTARLSGLSLLRYI